MSPEDTRARGIKAAAPVDSARLERRLHSQRRTSYPHAGVNASPPPPASPRIHEPVPATLLAWKPAGCKPESWLEACARVLAVLARGPVPLSRSTIAMWADVYEGHIVPLLDALCGAELAERLTMQDLGRPVERFRLKAEQGGAR